MKNWPKNWSKPSPVFYQGAYRTGAGMIFIGRVQATNKDFTDLKEALEGKAYDIDTLSIVGRYDRSWTTANDLLVGTPPKEMMGGFGSPTYEMQMLYWGVRLTDKPIWLMSPTGEMTKTIPPNGAYHTDKHQVNREGAEPGSPAESYIFGKEIYFRSLAGYYDVR